MPTSSAPLRLRGRDSGLSRELSRHGLRAVAGAAMAMDALDGVLGGRASSHDVVHEVGMAAQAVLLERPRVARR